jgi:hypothetical protein
VQVDGARLEIYGDFEAQRQPPRPSNTEYAVLATTKRDRFQAPLRESPASGPPRATCCQDCHGPLLYRCSCARMGGLSCARRSRRSRDR